MVAPPNNLQCRLNFILRDTFRKASAGLPRPMRSSKTLKVIKGIPNKITTKQRYKKKQRHYHHFTQLNKESAKYF